MYVNDPPWNPMPRLDFGLAAFDAARQDVMAKLAGPQGLSPGRLLRAALRHPDEGPTFARLSGGIPDATRGPGSDTCRASTSGILSGPPRSPWKWVDASMLLRPTSAPFCSTLVLTPTRAVVRSEQIEAEGGADRSVRGCT